MALLDKTYLSPGEVAAQIAEHYCEHDESHGYSQPNREGDGTEEIFTLTDGCRITLPNGDLDCSKLGLDCYRRQDISVGGATYSRNMSALIATGNFTDVGLDMNRWSRGDLLVVPGHVAVWLGNGMLAEAHHGDAPGGLTGKQGDQDGTEVRIRSYYDDGWTNVYHCTITREQPKDGWVHENGKWYHYKNGKVERSKWIREDETDPYSTRNYVWYYVGADGARYESKWLSAASAYWYFDKSGIMVRGTFVDYKDAPCFIQDNGKALKNGSANIGTVTVKNWKIQTVK